MTLDEIYKTMVRVEDALDASLAIFARGDSVVTRNGAGRITPTGTANMQVSASISGPIITGEG